MKGRVRKGRRPGGELVCHEKDIYANGDAAATQTETPKTGCDRRDRTHTTRVKCPCHWLIFKPVMLEITHTLVALAAKKAHPRSSMSTGDSSHLRGPALSPHGRRLPVRFGATRTHSHTLGAHDLRMLEHGVGCAYMS